VALYCPEFAAVQVMTGIDGDTPILRPPARQATVRNLITHTAGFGYWFWSERLVRWEKITGVPNVVAGSRASFTAPMLTDPGEAFIYGINIDWLGQVVEAVTGVGLDVAIKQGVTGPLGMDQTTFAMNDDQRTNSTPVHVKAEDGTWMSIGEVLNPEPDWWAGGHGLYGPPSDYIKLQVGLRAAAEHRGHLRDAPGRVRRLGGAVQHPVLGGPEHRRVRVCLQQLPAVRDARGGQAVQRLRKGPLRVAVSY